MKKLFAFILISLIYALSGTIFAIESSKSNTRLTFDRLTTTPMLTAESMVFTEIDLIPNNLGSWPVLEEGTGIKNYYIVQPPVNNKNNVYYTGSYTLEINNKLVHVLDSLMSLDSVYTLLHEYISTYSENKNILTANISNEFKKFQKEKKLEAKAYLMWPSFLILSLLFIIKYQNEDYIRNPLVLVAIASLIFTFNGLPDIIILFKGVDYSLINAIGK